MNAIENGRWERIAEQIEEGLAQLDRGEGVPGDRVFRALRLASGRVRRAEVHWYEAHSIGRKEVKRKRYLDDE